MSGTFQNFTLPHALILAGFGAATAGAIAYRRRHPGAEGERFDRVQAWVAIVTWVAFTAWWMMPSRWDRTWSWPIHLCDMAGIVAPIALWTGRRWARTLLHYWGLGLCTQALITPTLGDSPYDTGFWLFWGMHAAIVGPALYDVVARGYRPRWFPDCALVSVVSIGYLIVILPIDLLFGVNYGYLGRSKPDHPTLLDALGPWPDRLLAIILGVAVVYFIMTAPWETARAIRERRERKEAIRRTHAHVAVITRRHVPRD
jgi:hypothetical integral membrane protein (TIGR02206 family)